MFGSVVLDVALGVAFVFLLLSLICSALREAIEARLKSRSLHLQRGIVEMLPGDLAKKLYEHPLVNSLFEGDYRPPPPTTSGHLAALRWIVATVTSWLPKSEVTNLPSYIPARNFALALLDLAGRGSVPATPGTAVAALSIDEIRKTVSDLHDPGVERALLTALDTANGRLDVAILNVQKWYDSSMDRVSGWYKRETQHILFWLGLIIAVSLNVDTIALVRHLAIDKDARAQLVIAATAAAKSEAPAAAASQPVSVQAADDAVKVLHDRLDSLNLPIGWSLHRVDVPSVVFAIPGWLLTAFAITFGAPFWFDALNKLMVIRSTVKPHEKSGEEGTEDRVDKGKP